MEWSSVLRLLGAGWLILLAVLLFSASRPRRGPWWRWVPAVLAVTTAASFLWVTCRWDLSSVYLRPLYPPLFVLALLIGLWRHRTVGERPPASRPRLRAAVDALGVAFNVLVIVLLAPATVAAFSGYVAPEGTIDLRSPLRDGHFVVAQGGGEATNAHAVVAAQRHALDINAVNRAGFSQRLWRKGSLEDYVAFGRPVVAPCAGLVSSATDEYEDRFGSSAPPKNLAGNHVVLDCGDVLVLLAHLRAESVAVEVGERVVAGTAIGEIGNSGNTTEPHLHIHVVRDPGGDRPAEDGAPDPLAAGRVAVPFTIDGHFLVRGERVPDS